MAGSEPQDSKQPFLPSGIPLTPLSPDATPFSPPPQYDAHYDPPDYRKPPNRSCCNASLPSRHALYKFWMLEALASAFSIILFIVIVALLAAYDKKPYGATSILTQENEMKRPTIFPVLSLISAVMRASMLLPVATCIGQLKWSWFRSRRRLVDVERFDEASRGITGSLVLLWTVRFRHLAAVGAALTILALPIDSLIQSAILLPQKRELNTVPYWRESLNTTVTNMTTFPKTNVYSDYQGMESDDDPWAATTMINAVKFGVSYMTGLDDAVNGEIPIDCPTGYCEFGQYQTLTIRSYCVDRSDEILEREDDYPYLTLPDTDLRLYHKGGKRDDIGPYRQMFITSRSYTNYSEKVFGGKLPTLITRTVVIVNRTGWETPVAFECAFRWAVRTVVGEVNQAYSSFMNETTVSYNWTSTDKPKNENLTFVLWPNECWVNNTLVVKEHNETFYNQECSYRISKKAQKGLQNLLLDDTDGLAGDSILISRDEATEKRKWTRTNDFVTNIWELMGSNRAKFIEHMDGFFDNIALMMTRVARTNSGLDEEKYTQGFVYRWVFVYHVNWQRLAFPTILVFGSNMFFVATAVLTSSEYGWRRSNLPLLFHGLGGVEREVCNTIKGLAAMEMAAEGMHVKLEETAEGTRLVSASTA